MNSNIANIDEAGRGPLAGPVVAAAVILPESHTIEGITDSKKIKPQKRQLLYKQIKEQAKVGIGIVSNKTIDKINILQATFLAMKLAVRNLPLKPNMLLIDGDKTIPECNINQKAIIKGDSKVEGIGAASIIAKVTRDKIMEKMDLLFPLYSFAKHKGYGTKLHKEAIIKYGPSVIHRKTFCKFYYSND